MDTTSLNEVLEKARCIFTEQQIASALDIIADQISVKLSQLNPLVLCVMNGGIVLTGHLAPRLRFPLQMDYVHATRYRGQLTGADIHWRVTPATSLKDRVVLVLDDIFDEGETLSAIKDWCENEGAAKVYTAVLVDKKHNRKTAKLKQADFTALHADDYYLFGYGMDYKGYWRNAPGIYAVI
ncbi:MAG: hypoxanthine-guanine phosphoribosyltransferase [Pseudohongiella sp.]|nr:hypoxanthine-guanine phosphoribosyltransferase [Pseudohongiella sp.]MDO9521518.1 hypoxanthine-guanine phosphoribosyltransferase [Pseudohongiella sp.]MDP2127736.1 hypoxanthine-guanine phosphoribosyltransferase [Pseudohongiella sp.]